MNKELSQLLSKKSFEEIDRNSLIPEQLQQVVTTRWVITQRPSNNGHKGHQAQVLWQGLLTIDPRHRHPDICSNTFFNGYATTSHNRQQLGVKAQATVDKVNNA
eukprot:6491570-Amphidinium_carterae.4